MRMKILVDKEGWAAVSSVLDEPTPSEHALPQPDPTTKPSGVYLKVSSAACDELAQAPTEPSPPSDEAMAESAFRLPGPPSVPRDLVKDDDSRVA
jgi:hypothetical protein